MAADNKRVSQLLSRYGTFAFEGDEPANVQSAILRVDELRNKTERVCKDPLDSNTKAVSLLDNLSNHLRDIAANTADITPTFR